MSILMLAWCLVRPAALALSPLLAFAPLPSLAPGDHANLSLLVTLPASTAKPLLITLSREGEAIDVVKGRLLRSDAREDRGSELTFAVPIVAKAAGTALIHARAQYYECQAGRCALAHRDLYERIEIAPR